MNVNSKFKNSLFVKLFDDPDLLRELYCALEGVTLPPDAPVTINTLENVLFMDFNNDLSFEIDGKLIILIEHQSTINPNMAIRMLIYIVNVLESLIESKKLYSTSLISIPWPEFYVLYNGPKPYPDEIVMKLSDHFKNIQELDLPKKPHPLLELEVKVLNINEGRNEHIVNRCKKLAEYSLFTSRARSFTEEMKSREKGIKAAIKYCMKHGILNEFLEIHAKEILNMLLTEWNTEDAIAYAREEAEEMINKKWQSLVADKDMEIARLRAKETQEKKSFLTGWNTEDAIAYAREETEEKWRSIVADKDLILAEKDNKWQSVVADKDMEIARLKAELKAQLQN